MEHVLVNIEESGPEWLEWCAAMYESYAADHEYADSPEASAGDYASAAQALCESLEFMIYQERQNKIEYEEYCQDQQAEYDLAWGCWQETIYNPDR